MTFEPVHLERQGDIALVTIDSPPVNAVGQAVRAGLVAAASAVARDPAIRGAVLRCAGRTFVAGADITEFGRLPAPPSLRDSFAALAELDKPVVALLHGTALGGGLELALACTYRVIDPDGQVGLPEVTLGIIPGAGGTQRLPRLIGTAAALDLITSARRVGAHEALRQGIVDAVAEGDRLEFALAFLRTRLDRPVPRLDARPFLALAEGDLAALRATVARRTPGQIAPVRAIEVAERSVGLDIQAGLDGEHAAFEALRTSPQSEALRHVFFAERAVAKVPGGGTARPFATIGLVGGGTLGAGIAVACLLAGLDVRLVERDEAALAAARARLDNILGEAVKRGKLARADQAALTETRLRFAIDMAPLADADLVVEAVPDTAEAKREVFRALDAVARPGAVLATSTSFLDVAALAAATGRPADVIGLHFLSPPHVAKLAEVVVPDGAAPDAVATGFALAKRLGKLGVWAGNREGFIGNRILWACCRAADGMVEDGASPHEIDATLRDLGFSMGVFALQDLAGLDLGWASRKRLAPTRDPAERRSTVSDRLCERGWFGRKSGRGYYLYDGDTATPDLEVDAIVAAERRAKNIVPRAFASAEIERRILLAAANEGARVFDEGVALRAGDIDVVMVNGYGFPRWRGGPMHAAEAGGLATLKTEIEALGHEDPLWRVAPLIERLVAAGKTLFPS